MGVDDFIDRISIFRGEFACRSGSGVSSCCSVPTDEPPTISSAMVSRDTGRLEWTELRVEGLLGVTVLLDVALGDSEVVAGVCGFVIVDVAAGGFFATLESLFAEVVAAGELALDALFRDAVALVLTSDLDTARELIDMRLFAGPGPVLVLEATFSLLLTDGLRAVATEVEEEVGVVVGRVAAGLFKEVLPLGRDVNLLVVEVEEEAEVKEGLDVVVRDVGVSDFLAASSLTADNLDEPVVGVLTFLLSMSLALDPVSRGQVRSELGSCVSRLGRAHSLSLSLPSRRTPPECARC
jgi:hypothetical protein